MSKQTPVEEQTLELLQYNICNTQNKACNSILHCTGNRQAIILNSAQKNPKLLASLKTAYCLIQTKFMCSQFLSVVVFR